MDITTVTNPESKPMTIAGKTYATNNMTFIKTGNKMYFVTNAEALSPTDLERMDKDIKSGVTPNLKAGDVLDMSDKNNQTLVIAQLEQGKLKTTDPNVKATIDAKINEIKAMKTEDAAKSKVAAKGYKIGQVQSGYRYTGGNPADPNNWEKVK